MRRVFALVLLTVGMTMVSTALLTSVGAAAPTQPPAAAEETPVEQATPVEEQTPPPLKPLCHYEPGQPDGSYQLVMVDATAAAIHLDEHQGDYLLEDAESCAVNPEPTPTAKPTQEPTAQPTVEPTTEPTAKPTTEPTATVEPTPTVAPTATAVPTATAEPTVAPTPTPDETASAPSPVPTPTPTPTPTAEVLGKSTIKELPNTGFDGGDLAAVGLTVVAAGLIALWRSEEHLARGN